MTIKYLNKNSEIKSISNNISDIDLLNILNTDTIEIIQIDKKRLSHILHTINSKNIVYYHNVVALALFYTLKVPVTGTKERR